MKDSIIIVGAGFAGSVSARVLAEKGHKVVIYEKRVHIGGNCYDELDENGILIHKYGPHLFHTSSKEVWEFLSRFTSWQPYEHKVKASIQNKIVPIPFNFNTIEELFGENEAQEYTALLKENYKVNSKVPILELRKNEKLKKVAEFIYKYLFKNYTLKQWGLKPEELDENVSARVPVFIGRDNRYFNDTYQAIPKEGYTKLFEKLLEHENITLHVNTDAIEFIDFQKKHILFKNKTPSLLIFSGALDELFGYKFSELQYRSIDMQFESISKEWFQDATTVNYPNEHAFTRITEFKHIHPTKSPKTTILKEFPTPHVKGKTTPYYPYFNDEAKQSHELYKNEALKYKNLLLLGRLAEYKYYDMDDVVLEALGAVKNHA